MNRKRHPRAAPGLLLLAALALPAAARAAEPSPSTPPASEEFHYRWALHNFLGTIAGLFLPNHGEGELTFKTTESGHLKSERMITSREAGGDYWRYGAEIDPARLQPIRAWSSYAWRGKSKSESQEITQQGVIDIVSAIYSIRNDPPEKPRRVDIWSDDKVYPVLIMPRGSERRTLPAGAVDTRHYAIRGIDSGAGRRQWKGKVDLWLATDPAATPVVIQISRSLADVRLELTSLPKPVQAAARPAAAPPRPAGTRQRQP
jgi:hypothetical protein